MDLGHSNVGIEGMNTAWHMDFCVLICDCRGPVIFLPSNHRFYLWPKKKIYRISKTRRLLAKLFCSNKVVVNIMSWLLSN